MSKDTTPTRLYKDQQELLHAACCARDQALAWVADLLDQRESKGIGAALTAFDRLQERIDRLEDRITGNDAASGDIYITLPWAATREGDDENAQGESSGTEG